MLNVFKNLGACGNQKIKFHAIDSKSKGTHFELVSVKLAEAYYLKFTQRILCFFLEKIRISKQQEGEGHVGSFGKRREIE